MQKSRNIQTGFLGFGSMGSMLVTTFLQAGALLPDQVLISTRTVNRCHSLIEKYPSVTITDNNRDLVKRADRIILGVKPLDILPVLRECADILTPDHHIISMAGCVQIQDMEDIFMGKITRILPSITNRTGAGCILCCHNSRVSDVDAQELRSLLGRIGRVIPVREDQFEAAGDLMSCAPALLATLAEEFTSAGLRHSSLNREQAQEMVFATLHGTGLLLEQGMTVAEIIDRVATPGGITEEGVKVLRAEQPLVFDHLFEKTLAKHTLVRNCIKETKTKK